MLTMFWPSGVMSGLDVKPGHPRLGRIKRKTWMPGTSPGMTKLMNFDSPLPIDDALPQLTAALRARNVAVLVAARAAADRMASTLGERVGDTVGLRVRFGSRVSARTRIEVVTEGVFTRLI